MYSKRKKVVTWVILMAKQTSQHKMQEGYSKYGLCVWTLSAEIQVSLQPKELSLDEATVLWCRHLKFRTCSPGKIKYEVLVIMVCEAVSDYNCKMVIYAAKGQKLEDTFLSHED
jgi:hypothetical protein